jgi:SHS2 domain-containing protein
MQSGYRIIDHTADKAIEVWAPDLGRLILEAARGLIALLVEADSLTPQRRIQIAVAPREPELLLHDALSEILYLTEDEELMPLDAELLETDAGGVTLDVGVVDMDVAAPYVLGLVKAVTYHNLDIERTPTGLRIQVTFDT